MTVSIIPLKNKYTTTDGKNIRAYEFRYKGIFGVGESFIFSHGEIDKMLDALVELKVKKHAVHS